jgi:hypothetical protein
VRVNPSWNILLPQSNPLQLLHSFLQHVENADG